MRNKVTNIIDDRLFKIKILSSKGDNINLKFPINFVKRMIKINGINWLSFKNDLLDTENLSKVILHALDYDLTGNIANIKTKNDDIIKITID